MKSKIFIAALSLSVLLAVIVSKMGLIDHLSQSESVVINPILDLINHEEIMTDLDLSYYKQIKRTTDYGVDEIPIIAAHQPPYDVFIVGDSSVLMGLTPEVIKQVSGKNVGVFTYPAMKFNQDVVTFIKKIKDKFMTNNPVIILIFDPKFLMVEANETQSDSSLESIIKFPYKVFRPISCIFCNSTDKQYKQSLEKKIKNIFSFIYIESPAIRFYHFFIEQFVSKKAFMQNKIDTKYSKRGQRYTIQDGSVFIHKSEPRLIKKQRTVQFKEMDTTKISWLNKALTDVNLKPVFWVPLTPEFTIRQQLLTLYHSELSNYQIIDANDLMEVGQTIEAQNRTHLANLGAIKHSQLMGKWLKK